jgi:hypothetical protein
MDAVCNVPLSFFSVSFLTCGMSACLELQHMRELFFITEEIPSDRDLKKYDLK